MANKYFAGQTGTQFLAELNRDKVVNILSKGAVGDGVTLNTTAIQNAINEVKDTGGTVFIPCGTFLTGTLTSYNSVLIVGENMFYSILKSNAAETLINGSTSAVYNGLQGLQNLTLDGNGTGTIGYVGTLQFMFDFRDLYVKGFTDYGIHIDRGLIGSFNNCYIYGNGVGVYLNGYSAGIKNVNLISFNNCKIDANTVWGLKAEDGLLIRLNSCNLELNGTIADATKGAIYYKPGTGESGSDNIGLILDSCWLEFNIGLVAFIDEPFLGSKSLSIFRNVLTVEQGTIPSIKVVGATTENKLILESCTMTETKLTVDGVNAKVINHFSVLGGTVTLNNNGKYVKSINLNGIVSAPQFTAALTDDTPTDTEIDTATGLTPATAGAGWQCTIKDSNGSGLCYKVESDGTSWQFVKMTIAS